MGRARTGWVGSSGLDQPAICMVAGQAPGAMEHAHGPIRIFVDPHRDLYLMEPVRILGDLQTQALIAHRVVLGHDPLLVHTQDLGEGRTDPRDEGGARFCRPHPTPLVRLGEELLGQVLISRRPLRNPSQGQLFRPSVLQGSEGALRSAPCLRRRGGDACHPHLLQGAVYLGQPGRINCSPGLVGVPVVGATIRLERAEEPLRLHDLLQTT